MVARQGDYGMTMNEFASATEADGMSDGDKFKASLERIRTLEKETFLQGQELIRFRRRMLDIKLALEREYCVP
jgi:hypothetical protein